MVGVGADPRVKRRSRTEFGGGIGFDAARAADAEALAEKSLTLLASLPPELAVPLAQKMQQRFASIELEKTAELKRSGASDRKVRSQASAGGTRTKKAASRASKRADAVNANPSLAEDVGNGELGEEQLDAIAHAAEKTGGDAANDTELLEEVKGSPADEANKITSRWLERRDDDNGTKTRYERQREKRKLTFGYDPVTGCETMLAQGDRETIAAIRKVVGLRGNELYRKDGGRDLPNEQHPRTRGQRTFDALHQLITESGGTTSGSQNRTKAPPVRSMIHLVLTVDDLARDQIQATCVGGEGLLPESVLDRFGCHATIAGTVFSQQGETLWHGRFQRHATPAQFAALVARDQGCVVCGTDPERCEAHHLKPWTAPVKGRTDIDEMALVCTDDHHWIHEEQLTLYWQLGPPDPATGNRPRVWSTRPATPEETPAAGAGKGSMSHSHHSAA
jgi:hypothetical protein